eukprot:UN25030
MVSGSTVSNLETFDLINELISRDQEMLEYISSCGQGFKKIEALENVIKKVKTIKKRRDEKKRRFTRMVNSDRSFNQFEKALLLTISNISMEKNDYETKLRCGFTLGFTKDNINKSISTYFRNVENVSKLISEYAQCSMQIETNHVYNKYLLSYGLVEPINVNKKMYSSELPPEENNTNPCGTRSRKSYAKRQPQQQRDTLYNYNPLTNEYLKINKKKLKRKTNFVKDLNVKIHSSLSILETC